MPEIVETKKGFRVTDASGKKTLARISGKGKKARAEAKKAQRRLEGQRRLILSGSKKTKIPRNIGSQKQFDAFLKKQSGF